MDAGRPTPTPTPAPTTTPLACTCPTAASTAPPAAPTITFTSTDSCPPQGAQPSNSTTGAIYFTAQVQFQGPLQRSLTAADFGVGSVTLPSLVSNSSANCSCGTTARREASPGMALSHALYHRAMTAGDTAVPAAWFSKQVQTAIQQQQCLAACHAQQVHQLVCVRQWLRVWLAGKQ